MIDSYHILVIDNNNEDRKLIKKFLNEDKSQQFDIKELFDAPSAIKYCQSKKPDCILIDYTLPGMNGLEFIKTLHQKLPEDSHSIIMLTNQTNDEVAAKAIKSGAIDYLTKNKLSAKRLNNCIKKSINHIKELQSVKNSQNKIQNMVEHDPLTMFINQKAFSTKMNQYFQAAKRYDRLSALLLIDIDQFNLIVDSIGEEGTEILLEEFSKRISHNIRSSDIAARLEKHQFAIILDQIKTIHSTEVVTKKLIEAINKAYKVDNKLLRIKVNVGLCAFPLQFSLPSEVIERAKVDQFFAKQNLKQSLWYYPKSKQ
ncbi:diguanylate cyclase [Thiotrichales bacterium 19S11-10]|nr:diguanylate cyclase [Thiotrichales bacterium 19S11-10]